MLIIELIGIVVKMLPIIRDAVIHAEEIFPESGSGAKKLELVRSFIEPAIAIATPVEGAMHTLWPVINGVITSIVASHTGK